MRDCPECFSAVMSPDAERCPLCGAALGSAAPAEEARRTPAIGEDPVADRLIEQFKRQFEDRSVHVPRRMVERAREVLAHAEPELRRVAVLFADLCGYSRMSREMTPEQVASLATDYYHICTNCILRRNGFVVKFQGDAVLAVFGAPVAFDRDYESAVLAALDIREACRQESASGRPIKVSIGVATGNVQSGPVDSPSGKVFDVYGETANLAARLEGAAEENEVLICRETHEAAARAFDAEETEPLLLKNVSEDYRAWRVLGARDRAAPLRSFDTPFRGRRKQVDALVAHLAAPLAESEARIAHVEGEAGIGKSRLVHEALQQMAPGECFLTWHAAPGNESILLWPVLEWLREEMDLRSNASPEEVARSAEGYLAARLPEADADPLLLEFVFGTPRAISALQGLPPERIQRNLFALVRDLILARGAPQDGPLLVVDDCQWLDPMTRELLRHLANWPGQSGIRLVLAYRSGAEPPLPTAPDHLSISLRPLKGEERLELLDALSPTADFLPEIRKVVLSRAAGNPLFLEEMMRLVHRVMENHRDLNGEALVNHIVEVIPASLRDLIQSRIDRLDARNRQVLQCGSLLGLEFTFGLIELFDMVREGLSEHLQALRGMRYLEELHEGRDIRYFFTHGLYRDVAYATMLEEQRRRLHAFLGERLEMAFAGRLDAYYETLAYHFEHGRDEQKALYYLVKAGDRQARLGAPAGAVDRYEEVIELLRQGAPSRARQVLMARILTRCARLHRALGHGGECDEMLAGALEIAEGMNNPFLALEARLESAVTRLWRGEQGEALAELETVLADAEELANTDARLTALNATGVAHWEKGDYNEALDAYQRLAAEAEEAGAVHIQADAFNNAGLIYWRWEQTPQALKAFKRALPLRRRVGDLFGLSATLLNMGILQERMGEAAAARRSYENARRLAEKTCFAQGLAAVEANTSNLERRLGMAVSACEHAVLASRYAQAAESPNLEAVAELNLGQALADRGDETEADTHLEIAENLARHSGNRELEIGASLSRLALRLMQDPTDSLLAEMNSLLQVIEKHGYKSLFARAWRLKADVLTALDQTNARTAREYREMARDHARDAGDFFEELASWRVLLGRARADGHNDEAERCESKIAEMSRTMRRDLADE